MSLPLSLVPEPQAQKLEKTVNSGQQIFDDAITLGVGRLYCRAEKMYSPKPASTDLLGRIEVISNPIKEPSIEMSLPLAVSLPVNAEETKHVIVFANGEIALVKPKPNEIKSYQEYFTTINSGTDNFMLSVIKDPNPIASLKKSASFGYFVIDPIENDKNEEIVLNALNEAKKTASLIKKQQEERKERFQKSALNILQGKGEEKI